MTACRTAGCPEPYRDYGDGYLGFCEDCADKLYRLEERGADVDYEGLRINLATLDLLAGDAS